MATESSPNDINPSQFKVIRGEDTDQLAMHASALASPLRALAQDVASLLIKHPILESAKIALRGEDGLEGSVVFNKADDSQAISVLFEGNLTERLKEPTGTEFRANWNGKFFRQPKPEQPPYVQNGDIIQKGQRVGWAVASKNSQWPVIVENSEGVITFAVENGATVSSEETILFYINEGKSHGTN